MVSPQLASPRSFSNSWPIASPSLAHPRSFFVSGLVLTSRLETVVSPSAWSGWPFLARLLDAAYSCRFGAYCPYRAGVPVCGFVEEGLAGFSELGGLSHRSPFLE